MNLGIGGTYELFEFIVLEYAGIDPTTQAAVDAFNAYFGITFQFGLVAWLCICVTTILARS